MNLRVTSWQINLDGGTPIKQVECYDTRREFEQSLSIPQFSMDICRTLYAVRDDETVAFVPDIFTDSNDIPAYNQYTILQTEPRDTTKKFILVNKHRQSPNDPETLYSLLHNSYSRSTAQLPKTYIQLYELVEGTPEIECWNCGEIFVGANPIRISEPRQFTHPDTGYQREEHLCDDCASSLVDTEDIELSSCISCGEVDPTCTLRQIDNESIDQRVWLCEDCALDFESIIDTLRNDQIMPESYLFSDRHSSSSV